MTLTLGGGPLASRPNGSLNFSLDDAPKHRLLFDAHPRRIRALVDGHAVLDSLRGKLLHESNLLPRYYLPLEDMDERYLEPSDHTTHCPFKGDAAYFDLVVGERRIENAVWHYPEPIDQASWLRGYASVYTEAPDLWLQEDETVPDGKLRDPYHRVDVLESSRKAEVTVGGDRIAYSDRPKLLFETGVPTRVYLLRADVMPGVLEPSDTTSLCPYKGHATYFHVRANGELIEDAAWAYQAPLPETMKAAGHVSFSGEGIEVTLD
jgi:uncharacterized protein (DUF427 family)